MDGPGDTMRIGELAGRVGLTAHVVRVWETRYGLLRPTRTPAGYRLYGPGDERRLRAVVELRDAGVPTAQAVERVLHAERLTASSEAVTPPAAADDFIAELVHGVARFDEPLLHGILDSVFAHLSIEDAIREVLMPFLVEVGDGWARGELSIAQEHFGTQLLRRRLSALMITAAPKWGSTVLLACGPGEQHEMALLCFGVLLSRAGCRINYLGADTPLAEVREAAVSSRAGLVIIAATSRVPLRTAAAELATIQGITELALAGLGVDDALVRDCRATRLPADVVDAVPVALALLGQPGGRRVAKPAASVAPSAESMSRNAPPRRVAE